MFYLSAGKKILFFAYLRAILWVIIGCGFIGIVCFDVYNTIESYTFTFFNFIELSVIFSLGVYGIFRGNRERKAIKIYCYWLDMAEKFFERYRKNQKEKGIDSFKFDDFEDDEDIDNEE